MAESLMLIAGLGNPGEKYKDTRHNAGFWVIDELASRWGVRNFQSKFKAEYALVPPATAGGTGVLLFKPQTFMNLSGEAIGVAVGFFKIPLTHILVISDEIDLPVGALRLRLNGGTNGHNGLKSVTQHLGTSEYARLRMGVGRSPTLPADVHVLGKIPAAERPVYEKMTKLAADGVELCGKEGLAKAMNTVNMRSEEK
jgi:PTH1 family peptidyl-tRNA hydrolase